MDTQQAWRIINNWRQPEFATFTPTDDQMAAACDYIRATEEHSPTRRLSCSCCGETTVGRQWHNRDTGYGLCPKCATWIESGGRMSVQDFTTAYGLRGVHFDVERVEQAA